MAWIDGVIDHVGEEGNQDATEGDANEGGDAIERDAVLASESKIASEEKISDKMASDKTPTGENAPVTTTLGGSESLATLCPLPEGESPGHVTIFVNELKLSDLKQVLLKADIQAEFSGGVLYCSGDVVAVRRNEGGRIMLEGTLCEDYFKIRNILYSNFAII